MEYVLHVPEIISFITDFAFKLKDVETENTWAIMGTAFKSVIFVLLSIQQAASALAASKLST
jgi:hypothetical protein